MDLWVYCLIVQAAYNFVIPTTSQIWSCNVHLHVLISKLYSSFQVNKFMTKTLKYLLIGWKHGCHARLGLSINKKPLRHFFLRHSGFFHGAGRIMLSCGHLVGLYCPKWFFRTFSSFSNNRIILLYLFPSTVTIRFFLKHLWSNLLTLFSHVLYACCTLTSSNHILFKLWFSSVLTWKFFHPVGLLKFHTTWSFLFSTLLCDFLLTLNWITIALWSENVFPFFFCLQGVNFFPSSISNETILGKKS